MDIKEDDQDHEDQKILVKCPVKQDDPVTKGSVNNSQPIPKPKDGGSAPTTFGSSSAPSTTASVPANTTVATTTAGGVQAQGGSTGGNNIKVASGKSVKLEAVIKVETQPVPERKENIENGPLPAPAAPSPPKVSVVTGSAGVRVSSPTRTPSSSPSAKRDAGSVANTSGASPPKKSVVTGKPVGEVNGKPPNVGTTPNPPKLVEDKGGRRTRSSPVKASSAPGTVVTVTPPSPTKTPTVVPAPPPEVIAVSLEDGEKPEEKTYCLSCGLNLEDQMETDGKVGGDRFEAAKYEQFLMESLHIEPGTYGMKVEDSSGLNNNGHPLHNFCQECQTQIRKLYELHVSMQAAVQRFDEERDRVALNFVTTFLTHLKPIDDFPFELHKESVSKKWKKIYTGEDRKEREIYKIIRERELKAASRVKRFQKLKGSFRARNSSVDAKDVKKIQQKMTSIYFTPKSNAIRKRRQMFLRVALPLPESLSLMCPICDKKFKHEYSLTIHLRSHAAENGKLYKCSICDKVCSTRQQLMHHRKEDHSENEKLLKCDACEETFTSRAAYKAHIKTHAESKNHTCDICGKEYPSSYYLKKHMISHENVDFSVTDLFSCKTCSKTFLRSNELSDHLKIHLDNKLFGCNFCGKGFKEEEVYNQHMLIHEGGNPYICDECGNRYASEALLVSHLKIHRPKGHVCKECGKACRSRDGLRKHQLIHTGKKPFSCHICNIGFIERKSFDAHMVKHTGKLPYKCNYCNSDEGFKDARDLRRHKVLKHPEMISADRKYTCDFCWNGFSTQEIMEEHKKKIHERYKCQHCHRVFKLGDHLRRHMYIHTGEKPYQCALCDKSFNQESNLKEHMYRHTGIRPHRCPHCPGVGYLRRMHLKEHMVKEHGTDKVPTLPMGRAAQNARRSGRHPVPTPVISGIKTESLGLDGHSSDQQEIIVQSSNSKHPCIIVLQSKPGSM